MRRKRDAATSHGRTGGAGRTPPARDRRGKARAWLGRAAAWRQPRRRVTKPGDADCRWLAREGADGAAGPGRQGRRRRGERARKCKVGFDRGRSGPDAFQTSRFAQDSRRRPTSWLPSRTRTRKSAVSKAEDRCPERSQALTRKQVYGKPPPPRLWRSNRGTGINGPLLSSTLRRGRRLSVLSVPATGLRGTSPRGTPRQFS